MNYKIINGTVLEYQNGSFAVTNREIYIADGKISFSPAYGISYEVLDAADKLIIPGLINMHTHSYMSFFRNYADDVSFDEWLFRRIMPVEDTMDAEDAYWTSLLSCIEMIETGTTCFVDMHMFEGKSCAAAKDAGLRAFIGRGLVGDDLYGDGKERLEQAMREKDAYESDMIKFVLSPHAIYSCSDKSLAQIAELSEKTGMLKQSHLSESKFEVTSCIEKYGKSPVEVYADAGFLDENSFFAHCVHLSEHDMDIMQEKGASVVTNPASNAKLGNGIAPIAEYLRRGINVCLGTDSAASNNTLNMFREMGLLNLMHKGASGDAALLPADQVFRMATVNAAKALKMEGRIGAICDGACADIVFLDMKASSLFPNNDVLSSLCYSANGSEVVTVMINGNLVMKDRQLLTIDREKVLAEVTKIKEKYLNKQED